MSTTGSVGLGAEVVRLNTIAGVSSKKANTRWSINRGLCGKIFMVMTYFHLLTQRVHKRFFAQRLLTYL